MVEFYAYLGVGPSHDSELGVGLTDGTSDGFAHQLRVDLWHKHLNWKATPPVPSTPTAGLQTGPVATRPEAFPKSYLDDFARGSKHWFSPEGTPLEKYTPNPAKKETPDQLIPQLNIDQLVKRNVGQTALISALGIKMGNARLGWEWDNVIDPDGS